MQKKKIQKLTLLLAAIVCMNTIFSQGGIISAKTRIEYDLEKELSISANGLSENSISMNGVSENEVDAMNKPMESVEIPEPELSPSPLPIPSEEPTASPDPTQTPIVERIPLVLAKAEIIQVKMETYKSVRIMWNPIEGVASYEIYRSLKKGSKYVFVKSVNGSCTSYVDKTKNLITGKSYYYKIRAVGIDEGKTVYGEYSKPQKLLYSVPAPVLSSAKTIAGGNLKLSWKKVKGADGYVVYRGEKKNGKFKKIASIETSSVKTYTIPAKDCNGEYFYRVKAYKKSETGKKILGDYSDAKSATVSAFASDKETYAQKCMRLFNTQNYQMYSSDMQARQNMTTITVNVWDLDSSGKKVSKTKTFMIHKNLAPTVEQIFKEIYEGKEKFPINSVGGYSWRGAGSSSEHNQGCAIDINPTQNAMIEGNGTVSAGSYWKPGTDPYSIPADGEVVKIFAKYGFRWGGLGWSSGRKDYMHFSYFGT